MFKETVLLMSLLLTTAVECSGIYYNILASQSGEGTTIGTTKAKSHMLCGKECMIEPDCNGANYYHENNNCQLLEMVDKFGDVVAAPGVDFLCCGCSGMKPDVTGGYLVKEM